ncbi:MAG TPA: single-stranded DNA-binding protein [Patescibacteria group bacterium]|nr:single-stranded DNA-binding protein [Patescibacteria group bacterium]
MASRSLNRVTLIGNLTRDPELRYTPQGTPVCTFGLATNRSWQPASGGDRQEETEFHRIVSWNKLAELCNELLFKGRKVYLEGRIQTRNWTDAQGTEKTTTEIVIDNMIILDSKRREGQPIGEGYQNEAYTEPAPAAAAGEPVVVPDEPKTRKKTAKAKEQPAAESVSEEVNPDDIPF